MADDYQFTDVYNDLKRKLMLKGIPENKIAFIHDANTEIKKQELFGKVREGKVRVYLILVEGKSCEEDFCFW